VVNEAMTMEEKLRAHQIEKAKGKRTVGSGQ